MRGISSRHTTHAILRQDLKTSVFFFNIVCLLRQTLVNFSAATVKHVGAEAGPVQNPAGFHNENIVNFERLNIDSGLQENRLKALRIFKNKGGYIFKGSLCESISNERKCILVQDWLGTEGQTIYDSLDWFDRVRTICYDYKLMPGKKLERVVSPECNENVASKTDLKNECKNPERQLVQLCRRRLDKRQEKSSVYVASLKQPKERFLEKASTFARGEAMTIGRAYESAKIEDQECSANRPSAKESLKAVSKNKRGKLLMYNYCASKMGAHGFSGKKLSPT